MPPAPEVPSLIHARGKIALDRCLVMGIVNRTPDSFYDGGRMSLEAAVEHSLRLVEEGADLLDLGAVKAGPGQAVDEEEESRRLLPLVERLASETSVPLSVETSRASIVRRAIEAGAAIVNDVEGLADEALCDVVASTGAALVLMHNGGQIRGRPRHPRYTDVVEEVAATLLDLGRSARARGVRSECLIFDAGLDFGKTTFHSLELLRRTPELAARCSPLLVAASRKDVIGESLDLSPSERLEGSLALAALSVRDGASIIRAHDVLGTVRTVRMVEAVMGKRSSARPTRGLWD